MAKLPSSRLLALARGVAEKAVSDMVQEELPYFDMAWGQITQSIEVGLPERWLGQLRGMRFAKDQRLTARSPFIICSVIAVLSELDGKAIVPEETALARGILAFAKELGGGRAWAEELAVRLAPTILREWREVETRFLEKKQPSEVEHVVRTCDEITVAS